MVPSSGRYLVRHPAYDLGIQNLCLLLVSNCMKSNLFSLRCFSSLFSPELLLPLLIINLLIYFFESSLFRGVLVHRFEACFFMLSIHLVVGMPGLLHPLHGSHVVASRARILMWISGPKMNENGEWTGVHNYETRSFDCFYSSANVVRVIKPRILRFTCL